MGVFPEFKKPTPLGKKVAVVGSGASGLSCAAFLAQKGFDVEVFESNSYIGGQISMIPHERLPRVHMTSDFDFIRGLGPSGIKIHVDSPVADPATLLGKGFSYVSVCAGAPTAYLPRFPGAEHVLHPIDFLQRKQYVRDLVFGRNVAVLGGGATAVDCAYSARMMGADSITILYRRGNRQMRITKDERAELHHAEVDVIPRAQLVSVASANPDDSGPNHFLLQNVAVQRTRLADNRAVAIEGSEFDMNEFDLCVSAFGFYNDAAPIEHENVFSAAASGTVVQGVAQGKKVAAQIIQKETGAKPADHMDGFDFEPVSLETTFFGKTAPNPFILSASPLTDGKMQCRRGLRAGWGGVVLKTAFDGVPIHIPQDYMAYFGEARHGNCDNVSSLPLDKAVEDVRALKAEFPDRVIAGSTGGPITGDPEFDCRGWQANTRKLEAAAPDFIEYSLSCPQGGDGSEGALAAQSASKSAQIIRWVLSTPGANFDIPKIFKMTSAVTSVEAIIKAVKEVFDEFPEHKAGITLANSFPSAYFRPTVREGRRYDDLVVIGMGGSHVLPISQHALASVAHLGVTISGNGGVDSYRAAADFLALGVGNVQICALAEEHGLRVIDDLKSGLSHWMLDHGFRSIDDLRGAASAGTPPVLDFMDIPALKRIPVMLHPESCVGCLRCMDCPYGAIVVINRSPKTVRVNATKCVGCSLCVTKCPGACLGMRARRPDEIVPHKF
eukprot:gnl/Chilomastix_cuspidata/14.p1 GENE.gnl/Chilomastix_cuspidata/14~~gnl/Chilomastix_cuspidata/14.p1  ORF type:complete len:842 (+),score=266.04 gnl/Chilomastix_cuspidata/14:354-2528(+)